MSAATSAYAVLVVFIFGIVALLIFIFVRRDLVAKRVSGQRTIDLETRKILVLATVSEDDDEVPELDLKSARNRKAAIETATRLLGKMRGDSRDRLVDYLLAQGVVDYARRTAGRKDIVARETSAELFGAIGDPLLLGDLIELVADRRWEVRLVAARALGKLRQPISVRPLLTTLEGPQPLPGGVVATSLLRIGADGGPALIGGLSSETDLVRAVCAQVLGELRHAPAMPELARLIAGDSNSEVREFAAAAAGRIGNGEASAALIACVVSEADLDMRAAAVEALGECAAIEALAVLLAELENPSYRIAHNAAYALAASGRKGLQILEDVSLDDDHPGSDHAAEAIAVAEVIATRSERSARLEGF